MGKTSIEWTDWSINPIRARKADASGKVRTGHYCEKISDGCKNCYASSLQKRFGMPAFGGGQLRKSVECLLDESKLHDVLNRRKPTKIFWCDMSDLFGEWVPDEWIDACFAVMAITGQHTHQVLTKRPERMLAYLQQINAERDLQRWTNAASNLLRDEVHVDLLVDWPAANIWLGVSAENQEQADKRIPPLLQCEAAVHFVSYEPALGPISFAPWLWSDPHNFDPEFRNRLAWIIAGGESGQNARPCNLEWLRSTVVQCSKSRTACFVKQLGAQPLMPRNGDTSIHMMLRSPKGGDWSEWPEDLRVRQFPEVDRFPEVVQ